MPTPGLAQLLEAQVAWESATVDREAIKIYRNRLICSAYAAGVSQMDISRLLGLAQTTIAKIIASTQEDLVAFTIRADGRPTEKQALDRRRRAIKRRRRATRKRAKEASGQANPLGGLPYLGD